MLHVPVIVRQPCLEQVGTQREHLVPKPVVEKPANPIVVDYALGKRVTGFETLERVLEDVPAVRQTDADEVIEPQVMGNK